MSIISVSDTKTTGVIGAVNDAVTLLLPEASGNASVAISGTWVGLISFEITFDNTFWQALQMNYGHTTGSISSGITSNGWTEGALPAGAVAIRARFSAFTSGTATVIVSTGQGAYEATPTVSIGSALLASGSRIGATGTPGIAFTDTTANLAAAGTITTTVRDSLPSGVATANIGTTSYPRAFRIWAASDVVGTVNLEISADNTTFHRIDSQSLVAVGSSFAFFKEYPVMTRYYRMVYVNGATIQTKFILGSSQLA
jgi:hypothetical protein